MSVTSYKAFHEKRLAQFIFPFLSQEDRENLDQADKVWHLGRLDFEAQNYKALKDRVLGGKAIYMTNGSDLHQEMLLGVLGDGGSKKAIELHGGHALMIPNMDVDPLQLIVVRWKRMVHEEVAMSQLLTKLGILSPLSQRVSLSLSEDSHEGTIPAYLSETFENLGKTRGWFIIDTKNPQSSTWKRGGNFLFNSEEERLIEENWDSVLDSMLTDVAKIAMHDIPAGGDALNIAVMRKPLESNVSPYEIRYFGFDFSSKHTELSIPKTQEKPSKPLNTDHVTHLLHDILNNVFFYEFGRRYDCEPKEGPIKMLKKQLVEKYSAAVVSRISS